MAISAIATTLIAIIGLGLGVIVGWLFFKWRSKRILKKMPLEQDLFALTKSQITHEREVRDNEQRRIQQQLLRQQAGDVITEYIEPRVRGTQGNDRQTSNSELPELPQRRPEFQNRGNNKVPDNRGGNVQTQKRNKPARYVPI